MPSVDDKIVRKNHVIKTSTVQLMTSMRPNPSDPRSPRNTIPEDDLNSVSSYKLDPRSPRQGILDNKPLDDFLNEKIMDRPDSNEKAEEKIEVKEAAQLKMQK